MEPLLAWVFWTLVAIDPSNSLFDGLERRSVVGKQLVSFGEAYVDSQSSGYEVQYSYFQPYAFGPLQPFYSLSRTERGGSMFGLGVGYDYKISDKIFVESSFLPGIYLKNDDADLGDQPFFRAKLGFGYQFSKNFSVSISYDHRSNGRVKGINPGMETVQANFGFYY